MENFFLNIRREPCIYFVKESELSIIRRSPLDGLYPYGRTGMTAQDPLQGFYCLKYNKAGQPDTRLIKFGKLTPFIPDEGGCANVLKWVGEHKLERLHNGKHRHIASYTLDELIDLGWDDAMYASIRGKDSVTGTIPILKMTTKKLMLGQESLPAQLVGLSMRRVDI